MLFEEPDVVQTVLVAARGAAPGIELAKPAFNLERFHESEVACIRLMISVVLKNGAWKNPLTEIGGVDGPRDE